MTRLIHGESKTRLYKIWKDMIWRCHTCSVKTRVYPYYRGKGIRVCKAWRVFEGFKCWALRHGYTDSLTIEREDSNRNYEPINCKWATMREQALSRERTKRDSQV